jgi:hypothetical protein
VFWLVGDATQNGTTLYTWIIIYDGY